MHRIESRTYVGQPGEIVTVTTRVSGGGQAAVIVNGEDMGPQGRFPLPPDPGGRIKWQIALMGPLGATCVVGTSSVDGGSDGDFLICQAHNPAPVHFYTCSVVQAPAMKALRGIRAARARKAPSPRKAANAVTKRSATRKITAKRTTAKKTAAKKTAAKRAPKKGGRS